MEHTEYYRCIDCLHIYVSYEKLPTQANWQLPNKKALPLCLDTKCFCGSSVEYLGFSRKDEKRIQKVGYASACDERCTSAKGPLCNCPCGAANHGTGRIIQIIREAGSIKNLLKDEWSTDFQTALNYKLQQKELAQMILDKAEEIRASKGVGQVVRLNLEQYDAWKVANGGYKEGRTHDKRLSDLLYAYYGMFGEVLQDLPPFRVSPEAHEFDWRPQELTPEDYYAFV